MTERTPRRWRNRILLGLSLLGVILLLVPWAVRQYLAPQRSAALIRDSLQPLLAAPVEIDSAFLALWGDSTVQGLKVGDYLVADRVVADVSVLNSTPSRVTLQGVKLHLRFDADGNLLTKLPPETGDTNLPRVQVSDATLILDQKGRPPLTFTASSLTMTRNGALEVSVLHGTAGSFALDGQYDLSPSRLKLRLKNAGTAVVRSEMLQDLPFVPRDVWNTLRVEGSLADLDLNFDIGKRVTYAVDFKPVQVTLLQSDRPHFRVRGVAGHLEGDDSGAFQLDATADDLRYGPWEVKVRHRVDKGPSEGAIDVNLKSRGAVAVDQLTLQELPYVPKSVWDNVKAEGRTQATVDVRLWSTKPDVTYSVALDPIVEKLQITSIDLLAQKVTGKVKITDGLVQLDEVKGGAAKGNVRMNGTLDFRDEKISTLRFGIHADRLYLRELPTKWELPGQFTGKISGSAEITVRVDEKGVPTTSGKGTGRITEAGLGVVPILAPIELELYAERGRLKFRSGKPAVIPGLLGAMMIGLAAPPPPPGAREEGATAAVRSAGDAVLWLTRGLSQGTRRTADALSWAEKLTRPGQEVTYLDARFQLPETDLATLVKQFGATLPAGLEGRVSTDLTASIPINNARDFSAYRLRGTARASRLEAQGIKLTDVQTTVRYRDGVLQLPDFTARLGSGRLSGVITASLAPKVGDLSLDLTAQDIELLPLLPREWRHRIDGSLGARVRLQLPLSRIEDRTAWRGTGQLSARRLDVEGWPLRDVVAELTLARGVLGVVAARGELFDAKLNLSGAINLITQRYETRFQVRGFNMAKLALMVPADWSRFEVLGNVHASGELAGSLAKPSEATGEGRLRVVGLRLGKIATGTLQSRWRLEREQFSFPDIQGQFFGGLLTGKGTLTAKDASFALYLAGVDAAEVARRVPEMEFPIRGRANLKTTIQLGFEPLRADVAVDLNDSRIWIAGLPVRDLRGTAQVRNGRLNYAAQGDMLGGRLTVEGRYPPPPVSPVGQPHGRFRVDRLSLSRMLDALSPGVRAGRWDGTASLDLPYRFDGPNGSLTGRGRFELRDLRYNDNEISDSVRGDLRLARQGVYLRDASGTVAGGLLRFQGAYRFDDASRGWFNLSLSQAELANLAILLGERTGYKGAFNLQLRGNLGPEWRGTGEARLTRGAVTGVSVSEWTLPLDFTFIPTRGVGELNLRESSARVGDGRAQVRGRITFGDTVRAEGNIQLREASVGALAGLIGDVSDYVQGKITGRVDIGGSEMRSVNDLTANMQFTLRETQALQLPILRQLAPLLSIPGGRATVFSDGRLEARLARGILRIREFTLESPVAQMIIQGNVTTAGRLDLDVVARTAALGNINPVALRLIAGRIPAIGPVPVGLIVQASEFLASRVLHFKVRGTTRVPVIQIEPLGLLSQEAARFLLSRLAR